jgi:hypothetical protein
MFIGSTQNEGDIFVVAQEEPSLGFTVPVVTNAERQCNSGKCYPFVAWLAFPYSPKAIYV